MINRIIILLISFCSSVAHGQVKSIQERSPILKEMIASGQIGIVGGIHDISTGEVTFYPDTQNFGSKN